MAAGAAFSHCFGAGAVAAVFRYTALRGSVKAITSEAEKNLYKGSVVMVSASYRPSSKVVVRGGGVCGGSCASGKKIFFIYQSPTLISIYVYV